MSEELGKIEKPLAEEFKKGIKLYFVPLVYQGKKAEAEYQEKYNKYWTQLENQLEELELKLGKVSRIYHEFISAGGEDTSSSNSPTYGRYVLRCGRCHSTSSGRVQHLRKPNSARAAQSHQSRK